MDIFIFDDTVEHEAWNRSDSPRIILLIDFAKANYPNIAQIEALSQVTAV
ncbi:aspartyl/asparaginyl beta-hydroxylase domain-containing protein [Nostoc sp. FACHB-152]|nr:MULTISPECIES: aspartyl/asparaginyl beta-hydroxylase domain-containing protein [unclassified Nostoc]MBD2445599.1 aspartyl/asparaginyl beta-hydroxylase domain-containing protein [Nostoc sp. FACHB-152]MBD2466711.1 aspartyl/asparaginyl beta-hydroxylase domain-containing protein [Nostoc sp. FACHB-145]